LLQALPKRNIADRAAGAIESAADGWRGRRLLDRDREACDQPRHFVELSGVMILQRPRKTVETFVVAHRWHIAWDDRRYRAFEMNDGHQILQSRTGEASIVPE
jgi:hypothetical protein